MCCSLHGRSHRWNVLSVVHITTPMSQGKYHAPCLTYPDTPRAHTTLANKPKHAHFHTPTRTHREQHTKQYIVREGDTHTEIGTRNNQTRKHTHPGHMCTHALVPATQKKHARSLHDTLRLPPAKKFFLAMCKTRRRLHEIIRSLASLMTLSSFAIPSAPSVVANSAAHSCIVADLPNLVFHNRGWPRGRWGGRGWNGRAEGVRAFRMPLHTLTFTVHCDTGKGVTLY